MAVVLTSDTTRFDSGFQRAGVTVRNFRSVVDRNNMSLGGIARSTDIAKASIGVLRGNVIGLTGSLIGTGGLVFAAAAGAAALLRMGNDAAEAANKLENARVAVEERAAKVLEQQGRAIKVAANELEKSREGLEKESLGLGGMINRVKTEFNKLRAKATQDFRETFTGLPQVGQERTRFFLGDQQLTAKELEKWVASQEEAQKASAEVQEKMLQDFRRFQADMRSMSERLNDSLRSPVEVFADTINELRSLFQFGGLSPDKLTRGIEQAKKELLSAADAARRFREASAAPLIGAVDRNTVAGAAELARLRAEQRAEVKALERLEKIEQAEKQILEDGFRMLEKKEPVVFQRGNL